MNSLVNIGLSLHLAVCQSVTMPALLPPSAQPSAKEIFNISSKTIYRSPHIGQYPG